MKCLVLNNLGLFSIGKILPDWNSTLILFLKPIIKEPKTFMRLEK